MSTMRDSIVSRPTFSARMTKLPLPLSVPPITRSPTALATGIDSPVTIDSSTGERPSSTTPSTGIFSPGRTRRRSPATTASSGTSSSLPSARTRRALAGARFIRARMAPEVEARADNSSTWPSKHQDGNDGGGFEIKRKAAVRIAETGRKQSGRQHGDDAVEISDAGPHRDQREHVEVARARPIARRAQRTASRPTARPAWRERIAHSRAMERRNARRRNGAPMSKATTGAARTAEIHRRRVMAIRSPSSASPPASGSSAMPQIGQCPGPCWRISGCIGQV